MRIWDVHCHFPRDWQKPDAPSEPLLEHLAERAHAAGIRMSCLLSGGRWGKPHDESIKLLEPYLEVFLPVAMVDPETTPDAAVTELFEMGYRGLKLIGVQRDYDERDYFPMYAKAQELNMPVLFHLGVIGGAVDFLNKHPSRHPESAERLQYARRFFAEGRDISARRMHPFHLDTLANNFPRLRVIGAHMGGTGNYDAAASVVRWREHAYLDMSGGEIIERHMVERGMLGDECPIEKLVWGSDCPADEIQEHVDRFERIFEEAKLTETQVERLWWGNAAEIYSSEESSTAAK
ncbi:MAG TPA: amidohydrolase family protein [Dehalococcoidia bacterium]|nr:amidohydrolase family protein [Dehalococcoidia bacterium]